MKKFFNSFVITCGCFFGSASFSHGGHHSVGLGGTRPHVSISPSVHSRSWSTPSHSASVGLSNARSSSGTSHPVHNTFQRNSSTSSKGYVAYGSGYGGGYAGGYAGGYGGGYGGVVPLELATTGLAMETMLNPASNPDPVVIYNNKTVNNN